MWKNSFVSFLAQAVQKEHTFVLFIYSHTVLNLSKANTISNLNMQAVSGKDAPHNNFFFYDGVSTSGVVVNISNSTCQVGEKIPQPAATVAAEEIVL